jgi:hypothetical protein
MQNEESVILFLGGYFGMFSLPKERKQLRSTFLSQGTCTLMLEFVSMLYEANKFHENYTI